MSEVNKVVYGDETLIDLTSDTADEESVLENYQFHASDGSIKSGKVKVVPTWVGTKEEWESADHTDIADGTEVSITDDYDIDSDAVDSALSTESVNPVQNKVITAKINEISDDVSSINDTLPNIENSISDAWVSGTTYSVGALVIHNDHLWKCKTQTSTEEPSSSASCWSETSVDAELSSFNKLKFVSQTYSSITLNASGYYAWKDTTEGRPSFDGTLAFVTILSWQNNNQKCFTPTNNYLMGEASATITNLATRWWYY